MTTPHDHIKRIYAQDSTIPRPTVAIVSSEGEELFVPCDVPPHAGEHQDVVAEPQDSEDTEARG